jgi:hypothetical protein
VVKVLNAFEQLLQRMGHWCHRPYHEEKTAKGVLETGVQLRAATTYNIIHDVKTSFAATTADRNAPSLLWKWFRCLTFLHTSFCRVRIRRLLRVCRGFVRAMVEPVLPTKGSPTAVLAAITTIKLARGGDVSCVVCTTIAPTISNVLRVADGAIAQPPKGRVFAVERR